MVVACVFSGVSDDVGSSLCLHQFCGAPEAVCHGWFL